MGFVLYGIAGIFGGVLGGMGMGGGTVLIPILSIIYKVSQHTAQAINLISFIPMAIVALIVHMRNKFVEFKNLLYFIVPGIVTCIIGCYVARNMSGELLRRCFGGFLILLSIFQFITQFVKIKKK